MRKQDDCGFLMTKIFSLSLVFTATWMFEFSVFAMSKETANELNSAAIQAQEELASLNKQTNVEIRSRVQSDYAILQSEDLMLPENQVASAK